MLKINSLSLSTSAMTEPRDKSLHSLPHPKAISATIIMILIQINGDDDYDEAGGLLRGSEQCE